MVVVKDLTILHALSMAAISTLSTVSTVSPCALLKKWLDNLEKKLACPFLIATMPFAARHRISSFGTELHMSTIFDCHWLVPPTEIPFYIIFTTP